MGDYCLVGWILKMLSQAPLELRCSLKKEFVWLLVLSSVDLVESLMKLSAEIFMKNCSSKSKKIPSMKKFEEPIFLLIQCNSFLCKKIDAFASPLCIIYYF